MSNNFLDGLYLFEKEKDHGLYFKVKQLLCDRDSDYQNIKIFDTDDIGRVLMLDNVLNISTKVEQFYHEPMSHIPIGMVDQPEKVLIIGGGDFGLACHVLKHQSLNSVVMCELDGEVIHSCQEFFPQWAGKCEKDSRFELIVEDGFKYLQSCEPEQFDTIIVDSTDPYGPSKALISEKFYHLAYQCIKPGGVLMQIVSDALFYQKGWQLALPNSKKVFEVQAPIFLPIPFYATISTWGLLLSGKQRDTLDPATISDNFLNGISGVQTMTGELVNGWFSLPPYIQKFFDTI